jgi:hypothetical protein
VALYFQTKETLVYYSKRCLRRAYDYYNRRYFKNKLPHNAELIFTEHVGSAIGMTMLGFDPPVIMIAERIRQFGSTVDLTLLHEMAHIKLGKRVNHGKKFQKEMLRLANAGAMEDLW